MKMNGRRLIHHISIEKKTDTRDKIGGISLESWEEFLPAWAEVKPIKGSEFLSGASMQNSVTHRIVIRYRAGILPSMRIQHKDRVFEIEAVRDFFERERWIELMTKELI